MSKGGGAGKVYFVLYLAVVLELLIIIVERDEAEEGLHRRQRAAMQIVESILSQLQAGSGSESINTKPQDQITMLEPGENAKEALGVDIKPDRKYLVEVGVTDVTDELVRREGEGDNDYSQRILKLVELGNVEELEYQIFFSANADPNYAPMFQSEDTIMRQKIDFTKFNPGQTIPGPNGEIWEFVGTKKMKLDKEKTFQKIQITKQTKRVDPKDLDPVYTMIANVGPSMAPGNINQDSIFFYSLYDTDLSKGIKKRVFGVNFEPQRKAGWYKLRFVSHTNKILGVRSNQKPGDISPETKINIGTVQLTVGDLQKVKHELEGRLGDYDLPSDNILNIENDIDKFEAKLRESQQKAFKSEDARDIISKIQLYGYIAKLLAPGKSIYFPQNHGALEYNIRVILPENRGATPEIILPQVRTFDKLPAVFQFTISPYMGEGSNRVSGIVKNSSGATVANVIVSPMTQTVNGTPIPAPARGGKREYLGTVDKNLPAGRYTVVMTHTIGGKSIPRETELQVFETKLTDENLKFIKGRFERAYYAIYHMGNMSIVPASGGAIRSEEFRIYISTDEQGSQVNPIEGLSIPQNRAPYLSPKANQVRLKATWKQPETGKEIDILPEMVTDIRLRNPSINLAEKREDESQSGGKWRKTIRNIVINAPNLDENTKAKVTLKADRPQMEGIDNSTLNLEMSEPREVSAGIYEIELSGTVRMPAGKSVAEGTISIPLTATAVAKDKVSSMKSVLTFSVELRRERGRSGGGRSGGSGGGATARPSSGPSSRPSAAPAQKPAQTKPTRR